MPATENQIEKSQEKLAKSLADMKAQGEANREAIDEVTTQLREIRQLQEQLNLQAVELRQGPDGESDAYTFVEDVHVKTYGDCYLKNDVGCVQLRGHETPEGDHVFGLLDDPQPMDSRQRHLQRVHADWSLTRRILAAKHKTTWQNVRTPVMDRRLKSAMAAMPGKVGKIFADSAGIGDDFVPTRTSPEFEREVLAVNNIASGVPMMDHPGGTLEIPIAEGHLQAFAHSIPTGDDPNNDPLSSLTSDGDSIKCGDLFIGSQVHRSSAEQAIIPWIPVLRNQFLDGIAFADDNTFVNGDEPGTQDDLVNWNVRGRLGTTTNNVQHQLRRWNGIRRVALDGGANSSVDLNGSQDLAGFRTLLALMGIEQLMDSRGGQRLWCLVNPEFFFIKMFAWTEFDTWNDVGALAMVLTGRLGPQSPVGLPNQVGFLYGRIPVSLSYTHTADLNVSGVYDNVTTNRPSMSIIDRTRWQHWVRRGMSVEDDVEIRNNTVTVVARKSNKMRTTQLGTGQHAAVNGYNLTLT